MITLYIDQQNQFLVIGTDGKDRSVVFESGCQHFCVFGWGGQCCACRRKPTLCRVCTPPKRTGIDALTLRPEHGTLPTSARTGSLRKER